MVWHLGIAENLEVEKSESLCVSVWEGWGLLLDLEEVSLPAQLNVEMLVAFVCSRASIDCRHFHQLGPCHLTPTAESIHIQLLHLHPVG